MMTRLHTCCAPIIGSSPLIYQELLHSSSRYNATLTGERKRPCSGLARVTAHPRPVGNKPQPQPESLTGLAALAMLTLSVWFPAHWAPLVIRQLQRKEDDYRRAHPSWFDQSAVPDHLQKSWLDAQLQSRKVWEECSSHAQQ